MNCPYCEFAAGWNALHAHLFEEHSDRVGTEELADRTVYVVTCPHCAAVYHKPIKKASDPQFLVEFDRQIRLVALDMLMTHLLAEHEDHTAGNPSEIADPTPQQDRA